MPIKFRCPHCQQFLGISRSKAGAVTDCPTCGRTIRVPNLDGKIAPLPKPKLNYADTGLARALDELANLDTADAVPGKSEGTAQRPQPRVIEVAPPPPVEMVERPVPLPPEPIPVVGASAAEAESRPATSPNRAVRNQESPWGPLEELAALQPASHRGSVSPQRSASPALVVGLLCGFLGLAVGFVIGRVTGSGSPAAEPSGVQAAPAGPAAAPHADDQPSPEPAKSGQAVDRPRAIEGRVTYVNADGETHPDVGARILVLPVARDGRARLAIDGFRSGASEADQRVAQASIRASGGEFVLAGGDGHYEVQLPVAGQYEVVLISRYQGRSTQQEGDPAVVSLLATWFDRPQLLLGQTQARRFEIQWDGQGSAVQDQQFPKAP